MKQIPLSQNKVAIIDDEDFEWVNQWKWHTVQSRGGALYVARSERVASTGKQRRVFLHRLLLGLQPGEECDHKNGDGLDNRRANIRKATRQENNRNRRLFKRNKSGVTGVSWNWTYRQWQAHAIVDGKWTCLGLFNAKDDATAARRSAEARHYGEFAKNMTRLAIIVVSLLTAWFLVYSAMRTAEHLAKAQLLHEKGQMVGNASATISGF